MSDLKGDILRARLTLVSHVVHWTKGPRRLPGSSPQSIRTLPYSPKGVGVSPTPWGGGWRGRWCSPMLGLSAAFGPYLAVNRRPHFDFRLLDAP